MIIKSLYLNNFRQFKGENTIAFATEKDKNVTVIIGDNTSGKTTIVQAFLWCLYETVNFKRKADLLNYELRQSMGMFSSQDVIVEITLLHEGLEYIISRSKIFTKDEYSKVKSSKAVLKAQYKEKNGEQQPIPDYEVADTINKILPLALADYFFFDGERIENINTRKDVVSAVRGLMGIDVLGQGKDRFDPDRPKSVTSRFRKQLDIGSDQKGEKFKNDLNDYKERLEDSIIKYQHITEEIEYFEKRGEELSQKLNDNKETEILQKSLKSIGHDIQVLERNIENDASQVKEDFNEKNLSFFAVPLIKESITVLKNAKGAPDGIPSMQSKAIDYILKRKTCLCGCDLEKNQGAIESILHEKSLLPPNSISSDVRICKYEIEKLQKHSGKMYSCIIDGYKQYRDNINELDKKQIQLKYNEEKIVKTIDVDALRKDYSDNKQKLETKRNQKEKLYSNKQLYSNKVKELTNQIDNMAITSEKNKKLKQCIAYSQALYGWFKCSYEKQEKDIREQLFESVNRIFTEMYHGQRQVILNDDYKIDLKIKIGDEYIITDESKGLEVVKNFSFIAGLVDLARIKARNLRAANNEGNGEIELQVEPYPFVMDAPVSKTDEKHIANIAKILPSVAEQTIFIIMNKDWQHAKTSLNDKVGRMYKIEKVDNLDSWSKIRRMDNV